MVCKVAPKTSTHTHSSSNAEVDKSQEVVDYETALDIAGYGRFSRSALIACTLSFFATGVQNCVMSYVLPAARCELQLTTYQSGLINMAFMSGGVASAFFWGIAGDVFGRRKMISTTLLLDAFILLAQSVVTDYRLLLAARTLSGFLIGGPSTLTFSYLSDLVGVKRRQFYLNLVGMSFVGAWLILPAAAWLVIPFNLAARPTPFPIYSWRLYMALGSIPAIVAGIWILCLPESPRQLTDTNRSDQALKLLEKIYRANGNKGDFKVKKLIPDSFVTKTIYGDQNRTKELFLGVFRDLRTFVSKEYAVKSTLILFAFFANMAAGFGLILWIPELLLRMQNRDCSSQPKAPSNAKLFEASNSTWRDLPNKLGVFPDMTTIGSNLTKMQDMMKLEICDDTIEDDVYMSGVIVGAMCMVGSAACAGVVWRGGAGGVRRAAAACAAATAAAAAALAATACSCAGHSKIAVAAAAVLNAASLNGNVLLIRMLLHALPAKLSGLGVCWGAWWGRAGGVACNLAVGALLDLSCAAPFLAVAALLALSVGAIMLISFYETPAQPDLDDRSNQDGTDKYTGLDRYISTHI